MVHYIIQFWDDRFGTLQMEIREATKNGEREKIVVANMVCEYYST